MILYK